LAVVVAFSGNWNWGEDIVLHLRNGDRITGTLLSESTNAVVLSTTFSTNVSVLKILIDHRAPATNVVAATGVNTNQAAASAAKPPMVPATGVVSELPSTNKTAAAKPAVKPPEPSGFHKFISEWRGEAQLGANLGFSTLNREAFTGHIKLTENHKLAEADRGLRNIVEYNVVYGTTENTLSDNRMDGSVKTEYDLTKRFLLYHSASAGYDEIRGIDLQYDFGPGVGHKWIVLTNMVFKTEFGGDYLEQYFTQGQHNTRYSLRLDEDFWWQVTPKLRWDEKVEFFPEVTFKDYRVRLEINLSYLLRENLTLTLNVIDQYDTGVPAGVSKNDLQIRSLLGIKF
jgi:putative salt-induced outer membrane protein YdiY